MAEELGRRLFAENERNTCALDQILFHLSNTHGPPDSQVTRIAPIDSLIHAFLLSRPAPARAGAADGSSQLLPPLPRPPVVEINGIGPASGKAQLLYLAAARCLLGGSAGAAKPAAQAAEASEATEEALERSTHEHEHQPGTVVWMDLTGRFSARRLLEILKGDIKRQMKVAPTSPASLDVRSWKEKGAITFKAIEKAALEALQHIHIYRPQSTSVLIATLTSLPSHLLSPPPAQLSQNRPFGLLVLSGLSSFWWQDRHDGELDALGLLTPSSSQQQPPDPPEPAVGPDTDLADVDSEIEAATVAQASSLLPPLTQTHSRPADSRALYLSRWRQLQTAVRALQRQFRVPILASDLALAPAKRRGKGRGSHRGSVLSASVAPHLPPAWSSNVTARLLLRRVRRRFPPAISAQEAIDDLAREKRAALERKRAKEQLKKEEHGARQTAQGEDQPQRRAGAVSGPSAGGATVPIAGMYVEREYDTSLWQRVTVDEDAFSDEEDEYDLTHSEVMVNLHASQDWNRATWQEMESWRASRVVLKIGNSKVDVISEEARRRRF